MVFYPEMEVFIISHNGLAFIHLAPGLHVQLGLMT
jgi:hypothetical protein